MNPVQLLLPLALLVGACSREDAHAAARDTVEKAKTLLAEFKTASKEQLAEAQTAIEELKQKAGQAAEEHKPELERLARDLEARRQELAAQLAQLKDAGTATFDEWKRELEPKIAALQQEARAALERLRQ